MITPKYMLVKRDGDDIRPVLPLSSCEWCVEQFYVESSRLWDHFECRYCGREFKRFEDPSRSE